jgi:Zn-dependent protease
MPTRGTFQLARVFGIRVGVSGSWFVVLFFIVYYLSQYFHQVLGGSTGTAYAVAVGSAVMFFASLILHELGHALVARRLGFEIDGIDLWFFGGISRMRGEARTAGEEFKIAAAGPLVTFCVILLCTVAATLVASSHRFEDVLLAREGFTITPVFALLSWVSFINALLFVFNLIPAFPLDGGRIARALVWWRTGDRNRATRATGRAGQGFALALGGLGLWGLLNNNFSGLLTLMLAFFLYQAAGAAVVQGVLGQRIQNVTVADIMDREPVTIPAELTLIDAQEQFFLRYRWPWFAVVDQARHFLGVVRQERIEAEIGAGRPALAVAEALEQDVVQIRIDEREPLEALLRSEGMGRLGAMVAVDGDGVLRGVVTLAQVRRALRPAAGAS